MPAQTPKPPYYALNFTTIVSPGTEDIFTKLNAYIKETVANAPGFLGIEDAKGESEWITVTYWETREAIDELGEVPESLHGEASHCHDGTDLRQGPYREGRKTAALM